MENVDNLIFDLGGVILTLNMPETEKRLTELGIVDYNKLFRSGNVSSFFEDYEVGRINNEDFLQCLRSLTNAAITDDQLVDAWNAMLGFFPAERVQLLHSLKKKYRLFLFSNTNALHVSKFREKYREAFNETFDDLFEKAYYSNELGLRKPNVASFQYIIDEQKLDASRTAFIDDSLPNVEAAKTAGLRGIHIKQDYSILDIPFSR